MGCISPSASTPTVIPSSKKINKKKQNYHKSQLKIIYSVLPEDQNQDEEVNKQTQKHRKKINKVEFIHEQDSNEITEKIVLSEEQLTLEDKQILEAVVAKNSIFHKLSTPERKQLINKFVLYDSLFEGNENNENSLIKSDPYLFKKNDIGMMFFVIKRGKVQVELETTEGNFTRITYGKGDSFGELALLYRTRRTASVKCLGKCTFFCLSNKVFRETLQGLAQRTIQSNKILIQRIKLFQYLSTKQKAKLASHIVLLKYQKGDIVFREGQDSLAFFVVVSGRVDIEVKGKPLLQLKSGEYFGESCFQVNAKRSGTVQCSEKTQLMSISRAAIQKVLGNQVVQQFYYMSILKWALKRNPIFKQVPARSAEKLLKQSDIIHFVQGHELLKQGQKVKKLYIPIEGSINEFEIGDIVNVEYLGDIQKDKKTAIINSIPLVKKRDGYVCVIDINKVLSMLLKHCINIASINSKSIEDMKKLISSKKQIQQIHRKTMKYIRENNSLIKMQNLEMIKKIGQGQFGCIYKVRHALDNSFYALKNFNKSDVQSCKMRHFVKQQVQNMKWIGKHPFIVEFQKFFQTNEYFMILMEFIDGKDLFDTVVEIGWLSSEMVQFFFASFVLALEELHEHDIIYRDIKPENAVIDSKGYLKIIDLGTARKLDSSSGYRSFTIIGTPHYMAPEVIGGKGYSFEADIWSMGVLLYQMACGQFPFGQNLEQPIQIYNEIINPNIHIGFPKELKDAALKGLISRLLVKDPSIRSIESFNEIKDSEFYHNFDWQKFETKTLKAPYKPDVKHNLFDEKGNPDKKFGEETLQAFIQRMESRTKKEKPQDPFVFWDEFNDNI